LAEALLKKGAKGHSAEPDGTTALHWAVQQDDLRLARALLAAGAQVRAANRYGVTPLALAAINGSAPMVELLLKAGADPNAVSGEGETVLMAAARTGKVPVLITAQVYGAGEDEVLPFGGRVMGHVVKTILEFRREAEGVRRAIIRKHRAIAEGRSCIFRITERGIE